MDYVKLTYKKKSWVVKLKWHSGNLYIGKMWYNFAKAGNMCRGDTIVFQKTEKPQKYMVCVFEKKLFGKCNVAYFFSIVESLTPRDHLRVFCRHYSFYLNLRKRTLMKLGLIKGDIFQKIHKTQTCR